MTLNFSLIITSRLKCGVYLHGVTSDGRADRLGEIQGVNRNLFAGSNPKERKLEDKKQKYAYWMRPSMIAEMEEMLDAANATSKGDFVCQAVDFYIGYLRQEKNINYLSPLLANVIKDEVESVEKNISEMLFKVAVEQAKLSHIIAAQSNIDDDRMDELHRMCASDVAESNGIISFEDAYEFQHEE